MVERAEIFKAASNLIERFGDSAAEEADRRVWELRNEGEREAYLFWLEVCEEIRLLSEQRVGGKLN